MMEVSEAVERGVAKLEGATQNAAGKKARLAQSVH